VRANRVLWLSFATALFMLGILAIGGRGRADMTERAGGDPWDRCGECHGLDGAGNRIKFPRLAGQKQSYIAGQLYDFRAGRRKNDGGQMQQTSTEIAATDIERVADWFAKQTPPWPRLTIETEPDMERARRLSMSGRSGHPGMPLVPQRRATRHA
jgi:cytochrome c553